MSTPLFRGAMKRILRPLVRAMIGRGLTYPQLADVMKELFIDEAVRSFGLADKRMTDSRISVLTGLQRRDVKAHRTASEDEEPVPRSLGPIPRVVALWRSDPRFSDATGEPIALPRSAEDGPAFDTMVAEIGRDVHPRTILDEMVRLDLAAIDPEDRITLGADSLLPSRDETMLVTYYASNLGDHAEAAAANLLAAPEPGAFFERAVHYNKLRPASVDALEADARERQMALLRVLNAEALKHQRDDAGHPEAKERFRAGAFIFRKRDDEETS
ncbi:MAG: DUF6502 family protein [Pseudomonadota bacterium]